MSEVKFKFRLEAAAARALLALFAALPLDAASWLGGRLGRLIGVFARGRTRHARRQIARAMPELSPRELRRIVGAMWENLGRIGAELPHIRRLRLDERIEVRGVEHAERLIQEGRAALLFSGHLANWEILPRVSRLIGLPFHAVYRQANNPLTDALIAEARGGGAQSLIPKGATGAKQIIAALKAGECVGMLVDQKMNDGIPVPFFGRPAMTAPALAQLAIRFDLPIVPLRCERLSGARFRVTYGPPLKPPAGDRHAAAAAVMAEVNATLEAWIRERPEQWLWLHRRWPD